MHQPIKINILVTYRPLCTGAMHSVIGPINQLPDGRWKSETICAKGNRYGIDEDELIRAIKFLNKNSYYKHNITVIIDEDVYPNDTYLKEFENVKIIKSGYVHYGPLETLAVTQANGADVAGINSIPDEEWLCYAYQSDLICAKDWDRPIIDSINKLGENYVYVPMFTEVRGGIANRSVLGIEPTPELIWDKWRKIISCHALTMPYPREGPFFNEEDMDKFINIANSGGMPPEIIEKPGDRIYGYYALLIMKAKYAKNAIRIIGPGFDTDFDARLYSICNLMKAVITRSFVFHPFCEFRYGQ